jgi:N-acyl-L-homoserine lactone synthetase
MELVFKEEGFLIKSITTCEEREAAFRLRHDVFCDELKWVPPSPEQMEEDAYDAFAHPIGLFDERNQLVGHVRLIHAPDPFMIEKEFACLLSKDKAFRKLPLMAESTRICVKKEFRTRQVGSFSTAHLLYKAIYNWCLLNDARFFVTIIEKRYYRYLKIFFPFESLGRFLPLGDGVLSGIVLMDCRKFELLSKEKRPDLYQWMATLTTRDPSLSPLPGPCSQRRASSRYSARGI